MTLYTFKPDEENVSTCEGACADAWPPLTVDSAEGVAAGDGVDGTLAAFERSDGTLQVSYDGAPLYYFARDTAPGEINGHGAGDAWFVAEP
jgi:predicted lipoprotein with Yx(FWY)xxD motif